MALVCKSKSLFPSLEVKRQVSSSQWTAGSAQSLVILHCLSVISASLCHTSKPVQLCFCSGLESFIPKTEDGEEREEGEEGEGRKRKGEREEGGGGRKREKEGERMYV